MWCYVVPYNYIPPEGIKYSDIGMFDNLATDIISLNSNNTSDILLMDEFNARTRTKPDFVSIDL